MIVIRILFNHFKIVMFKHSRLQNEKVFVFKVYVRWVSFLFLFIYFSIYMQVMISVN
jgi:hypothetical protein